MGKNQMKWDKMLTILQEDVIPATGCTEPVALAFAAAVAVKELNEPVESIKARVSSNLMKNGMGVMVPGTGCTGLYIAAAVGALGGNAEAGLQVLEGLSAETVARGKQMVQLGKVSVSVADVPHVLYAEATVFGKQHSVKVCIADGHTNVVHKEKDGKVIFASTQQKGSSNEDKNLFLQQLTAREVYDFAQGIALDRVAFIRKAAEINGALSKEGLSGKYGLHLGAALKQRIASGLVGNDLQSQILIYTTAASDARMGGAKLPAMTNSGSGNQGITATEPVCVVAEYLQANEEELIRALTLSHMMAIYIHSHLPKLSALCAAATAAMGAAAGMAWLLDKERRFETISDAISTMTGDLIGMACDGAANSCSMKVGTACASAFRAVMLALDQVRITGDEGLVSYDVDETIRNIGTLACVGMRQTDAEILNIMLHKNQERKQDVV